MTCDCEATQLAAKSGRYSKTLERFALHFTEGRSPLHQMHVDAFAVWVRACRNWNILQTLGSAF